MGRNSRNAVAVGLVAVFAAFVPGAAAQKPRGKKEKLKEMTFTITWTISGGTWGAHYDCKCNHDEYAGVHRTDEQDHQLRFQATYEHVKIPFDGPWDLGAQIKASQWSATGSFGWDENVWQSNNHDFPVHCEGTFEKGNQAPVLSYDRAGKESFHFVVQSGKTFKVTHVTGKSCPEGCQFTPLYPASIDPVRDAEDMFSAEVIGNRDDLSQLKVRGVDGGMVSQDKWSDVRAAWRARSHYIPPKSCTWLTGGSCTEEVHWDADIKFQRTG